MSLRENEMKNNMNLRVLSAIYKMLMILKNVEVKSLLNNFWITDWKPTSKKN